MGVKVGDFLMSKILGHTDIFFDVTKVYTDLKGHSMFTVASKNNPAREDHFPLIFLDKYFIVVDQSVATILFGKKDEKKTDKSPKQ